MDLIEDAVHSLACEGYADAIKCRREFNLWVLSLTYVYGKVRKMELGFSMKALVLENWDVELQQNPSNFLKCKSCITRNFILHCRRLAASTCHECEEWPPTSIKTIAPNPAMFSFIPYYLSATERGR
nr:hypothetical protein Iba_chr06fCG1080 [Ipomoea batatas]